MKEAKTIPNGGRNDRVKSPIWRQALSSVLGAAERLHRYRDARDVLLGQVFLEQERRARQDNDCRPC